MSRIAPGLIRDADGIWRAATRGAIDYPDEANAFCFAVEAASFWFNHRNDIILSVVRRLPPAGPIADIGAGNGYVSLALQRGGLATIVIEPGLEGARNARSRGLDPVVCATLQDARFQERSLEAAGLFDVLEHIEDDGAFLADVHRLLKPGGRLYLTVPAFRALWSAEDELVGHHRRYAVGGLTDLLEGRGFRVDYATYFFWPLPVPLFLLRTLPSLAGWRTTLDPEQTASELQPSGLVVSAVARMLQAELALIRRGRRVPVGTSCLVAATAGQVPSR